MDNLATTKNITMKQFNGTDYDTLYPKTKVEQVENLTPSSIGAVNKTGDTMTGNLTIKTPGYSILSLRSDGDAKGGDIEGGTNTINLVQFTEKDGSHFRQFSLRGIDRQPDAKLALEYVVADEGENATYKVLHTGNAQSLGFSKIATGSYVGTGYSGQSHPMSINVGFAPKFFWICLKIIDRRNEGNFVALTIPGGSTEDSNGLFIYPFTKYFCSPSSNSQYYVTVTWGSTMSWYGYVDFDDTEHGKYQFNEAGTTYYWVAIG